MIWSTNYGRLASQTSSHFSSPDETTLQSVSLTAKISRITYRDISSLAFGALADRLRDAGDLLDECVIGWDSMNEPAEGFCGYEDLNSVPEEQGSTLRKGSRPTPAQSLCLGMGQDKQSSTGRWCFRAKM